MIDANVLVAGTICPRFFYEVLQHALRRDFSLMLTPTVIREARQTIQKKFPQYSEALSFFLETEYYEIVPDPSNEEIAQNFDLIRDPKDIPIALSAIRAAVDYLVTNDTDFTAQHSTTKSFHQKVTPLTAGRFLKEVMGWTSEELEAIRKRNWQDLRT